MLLWTRPQKSSHQREVQTSYARLHRWLSRSSQVAPCKQAVVSIVLVFSLPQHCSGWFFDISVNPVFTSWILPGLANTCPCSKMINSRTAQSTQSCWVVCYKRIHLLWRYFQWQSVWHLLHTISQSQNISWSEVRTVLNYFPVHRPYCVSRKTDIQGCGRVPIIKGFQNVIGQIDNPTKDPFTTKRLDQMISQKSLLGTGLFCDSMV